MKRFLFAILALLLLAPAITQAAVPLNVRCRLLLGTGAVTQANMRISAVAGTAFVDFSAAGVLTSCSGCELHVIDSAGKEIVGYIKAAGTGETYSAQRLLNPGFDSDTSNWTASNSSLLSVVGGQAGNALQVTRVSGVSQGAFQNVSAANAPALGLFLLTAYVKSGLSGNEAFAVYSGGAGGNHTVGTGTSSASWVQTGGYFTSFTNDTTGQQVTVVKNTATALTMLFDTISFQQVLTPSAAGVTITSTRGGSVFNWSSQDTGFNYNDSSGYTYVLWN